MFGDLLVIDEFLRMIGISPEQPLSSNLLCVSPIVFRAIVGKSSPTNTQWNTYKWKGDRLGVFL